MPDWSDAPQQNLREWAGSDRISPAITITDIVDSTALATKIGDEAMKDLLEVHFRQSRKLILQFEGRWIKSLGDGEMVLFHTVEGALDYALALQRDPGHSLLDLRVGIHIGPVNILADDIIGSAANYAARVGSVSRGGEVWLSHQAMEHIWALRAERHNHLAPTEHYMDLKGIGRRTLWSMPSPKAHQATIVHSASATGSERPDAARALHVEGSVPRQLTRGAYPQIPSIAILPFRNLQPEPKDAYIADGIVEEIVHALAGVKELFVISRASTLGFSPENMDLRSISRELGVENILCGSVRRHENRLRIDAELLYADSARVIFNKQFEGTISQLFDLQNDISIDVLKSTVPHVHEHELRKSMQKPPEDRTSYDLTLEAQKYLYRLQYDDHQRAGNLLSQAIRYDPEYARSYSYLAYWYIFRVGEGWSADVNSDAQEAARVAAEAIRYDSTDGLAYALLGHVQSFLHRDYQVAVHHFERAIDASPNCANAWTLSSATYGYMGDALEALSRAERGLRLSPLDAHVFWHKAILAQAHYVAGHYDKAVEWAEKSAADNPSAIFNLRTLAASQSALGHSAAAADAARRLLERLPNFKLTNYAVQCPFTEPLRTAWIDRLHSAGLPE